MADPIQYSFSFIEVAKALMKEQGIHEGRWLLAFELNFTAGVFGISVEPDFRPGGMMQIRAATLQRAPVETSADAPMVFDATVLNPPAKARRAK